MKSVSCIIPAYNEAVRIGAVLDAVVNHPLLSEIIVIDDGSNDGTSQVVSKYTQVKLIVLPHNGGKAHAVCEGVKASRGELLAILDADLLGLTANDVSNLI